MTGRAVQFALMPKQHPTLPGWETWLFTRPAKEVGGDLVDYLAINEDRLGLALADVAGKGLGAAMFMAKLQSTLRAIAPNFERLSDLGAAVNQIFIRDGLPGRFISLVYLEIEPEAGQVRLLNAGHLPPLVVHADSIEEMPKGAPALGLVRQAV
ncbi:MAG: SpoIIE family protein phosphatase, partial [Bacteroidetes bacterium]|nr:SpoIIE family protein phosphatase [Bacteroidota bacterium]